MENTTTSTTLGPADHGCRKTGNGKRNRTSKKKTNSGLLKVVYISSPMKVKTSASMFRSIVQELTGKYSDVARYMENNVSFDGHNDDDGDVKNSWTMISADADEAVIVDDQRLVANQLTSDPLIIDQNVFQESPTSSDSLYNNEHQFDGTLDTIPVDHFEMNLAGIFGSNFLMESTLDDITFEDFCLAA